MEQGSGTDQAARRGRWRDYLDVAATVAVVVVSLVVTWAVLSARLSGRSVPARSAVAAGSRVEPTLPTEAIALGQGPVKGRADAKVALIEYSDFQCPYCARFAQDMLPALDQKYLQSGKVLMSFQQVPLGIHAFAKRAAEGAECANRQGRFWEMHDLLFANQKQLNESWLLETPKRIGLNPEIFAYCLDGEAAPMVTEQANAATKLGITGTPTFFVGTLQPDRRVKVTGRITGVQSLRRFEEVLDALLETQIAGQK